MSGGEPQRSDLDRFIFVATAIFVLAVSVPLVLAPDRGEGLVNQAFGFVTARFGWLYIWASLANLGFTLWLALGRYGRVTMAQGGAKPEFSTASWASMLFCAGIGTGILYWGTIEWAYYYTAPPFGAEPGSTAAIEWATSYPIFHWGITGWAFYTLPAIAIGYAYFGRGVPSLRLSATCRPLIGDRADGWLGKMIDLLFMVGLLGAAGTGIGLAVPLISAGLSRLLGVEDSFVLNLGVIVAVTGLFAASVYSGLEKGIRRLSNLNVALTLLLIAFVLAVGPTLFLLKTGTNSIGHMLQNFVRMSFWTDPIDNSGFVESWTVFYWAWWIALGPFMGMFVARISKGRTLREVVFGMLGFGAGGCALFFVILGNYALHLELTGALSVTSILAAESASTAIVAVIASLPMGQAMLGLFCLVSLVFMATTYDSAAYTLALGATRRLRMGEHPARWHRMFWAVGISVMPATLMFLGGLKSFQTASLVVSVPLIGVGILMAASLVRALREDHGPRKP